MFRFPKKKKKCSNYIKLAKNIVVFDFWIDLSSSHYGHMAYRL